MNSARGFVSHGGSRRHPSVDHKVSGTARYLYIPPSEAYANVTKVLVRFRLKSSRILSRRSWYTIWVAKAAEPAETATPTKPAKPSQPSQPSRAKWQAASCRISGTSAKCSLAGGKCSMSIPIPSTDTSWMRVLRSKPLKKGRHLGGASGESNSMTFTLTRVFKNAAKI